MDAEFDVARCLNAGAGAVELANLPASAIGGGALNFMAGRGGEGVRSGDLEAGLGDFAGNGLAWLSTRLRRAGGNAGGGPLLDEPVLPVFWGLMLLVRLGGTAGGGGGAGALPRRSLLVPFGTSSNTPSAIPCAPLCSI